MGKDIILHTEGKSEGNYCYTRDCMTGLLTILLKGKNGEAIMFQILKLILILQGWRNWLLKNCKNKIKVVYDISETNIFGYANDTK